MVEHIAKLAGILGGAMCMQPTRTRNSNETSQDA